MGKVVNTEMPERFFVTLQFLSLTRVGTNEADKIVFQFPIGTDLRLTLDNFMTTTSWRIGRKLWPVNSNPVDLRGW